MWTVRELNDKQVCIGLRVTDGVREGVVSYLVVAGHDTLASVHWQGDVEPTTQIKNGDSDLKVLGWLR